MKSEKATGREARARAPRVWPGAEDHDPDPRARNALHSSVEKHAPRSANNLESRARPRVCRCMRPLTWSRCVPWPLTVTLRAFSSSARTGPTARLTRSALLNLGANPLLPRSHLHEHVPHRPRFRPFSSSSSFSNTAELAPATVTRKPGGVMSRFDWDSEDIAKLKSHKARRSPFATPLVLLN